jgi:hypothetical protein
MAERRNPRCAPSRNHPTNQPTARPTAQLPPQLLYAEPRDVFPVDLVEHSETNGALDKN